MVSQDDVVAAYRFLLGRDPENDAAITYHRRHLSRAALRQEILRGTEFANNYRQINLGTDVFTKDEESFPPVLQIETEPDREMSEALWARVTENWQRLGRDAPHWSVLTFDMFRPEFISDNTENFLATVASDMAIVDAALERLPNAGMLRAGLCLEVGCGVGRVTRGLARRFDHVLGVDISAPHLDIARADLGQADYDNVTFRQVLGIKDYLGLGTYNFFYSRIVLQHNPPPVQVEILRSVLASLTSPGAALFQVVTYIPDYSFSTEAYLNADHSGMEMHALPQKALFKIIQEAGLVVVEIQNDNSVATNPQFRSQMVLAAKS